MILYKWIIYRVCTFVFRIEPYFLPVPVFHPWWVAFASQSVRPSVSLSLVLDLWPAGRRHQQSAATYLLSRSPSSSHPPLLSLLSHSCVCLVSSLPSSDVGAFFFFFSFCPLKLCHAASFYVCTFPSIWLLVVVCLSVCRRSKGGFVAGVLVGSEDNERWARHRTPVESRPSSRL